MNRTVTELFSTHFISDRRLKEALIILNITTSKQPRGVVDTCVPEVIGIAFVPEKNPF